MPEITDIYNSPNGDRWRLVQDPETGHQVVRHEPNKSSGGRLTEVPLEEFLAVDGPGPEYVAVRNLVRARDRSEDVRGGETELL